jgi:hypothetical protein
MPAAERDATAAAAAVRLPEFYSRRTRRRQTATPISEALLLERQARIVVGGAIFC